MSSSPTNNEKLIASGELEQNMLPQPQSAETTLVDIPSDMECSKNVYNRDFLARSLGLETNFSSMVESSLTTAQPVSESPLELNKTRVRWTKADEVDTASWTRLVVEGAESTLFENVSAAGSDVQMHTELVCDINGFRASKILTVRHFRQHRIPVLVHRDNFDVRRQLELRHFKCNFLLKSY